MSHETGFSWRLWGLFQTFLDVAWVFWSWGCVRGGPVLLVCFLYVAVHSLYLGLNKILLTSGVLCYTTFPEEIES